MTGVERGSVALSVVIVNWNTGAVLGDCLRSLYDNPPTVSWEAIVVDNASSDGSAQAAAARYPSVRLIANAENRGLAAANNQGMVAARGGMVLISNPDVLYRPGAVDALVATLERHPRAAFVVPRLEYDDGSLMTSAGDLPTIAEALLGRRLQRRLAKGRIDSGYWWDGWSHDTERLIGRGNEAAYLVARQAFEEVGLQDERFFLDWEGHDWSERMRAAGWEIWFTPTATVTHLGGVSIRQVPLRWVLRSHLGIYRYFVKRHPWWRPWLGPLLTVRAASKVAAGAVSDIYERGHRGR